MTVQPVVTIMMPVRNEVKYIDRSLKAVLKQDYPQSGIEIIITDGLSHDGTQEHIQSLLYEHPNISLIENPGRIVPTGLNSALERAHGEIIIRVDGHCEVAPDYVSRCVHHLLEDQVDCVGGPIETVGETYTARGIAAAMSSRFGVGNSAFRTLKDKSMLVDSVAFPAYTRQAIEITGHFDEELVRNQDDEYNYRLRKKGGKILLSPDIRSRYYSRSTLRSLWGQYFQYGFWKVRVLQKHPRQMSLRQFVPPLFVAALLTLAILSTFSIIGRALLIGLAVTYILGTLIATGSSAKKFGWRYLPILPVAFFILHFSYGSGFIWGLAKFRRNWKSAGQDR
ncbi:MAG: glycosyltransferase family 2 protein [Anaerolineales bacterium]|nr:glycosyltransferase family 2 protein [Anaerolineales bacterium]